jgi:hypothetical protein
MRSWSKFASHLRLRDQRSMWMQDECKVYMDSYMTSNGPCFMVTWIIFKNHIFESNRPNTNPGDHGTRDAYNRWFILFHHMWKPTWIEIHWNNIWLRPQSQMTSHYTWGSVTHFMILGMSWDGPLDTFFWALTMPRSRLFACVWSGPSSVYLRVLIHIPQGHQSSQGLNFRIRTVGGHGKVLGHRLPTNSGRQAPWAGK